VGEVTRLGTRMPPATSAAGWMVVTKRWAMVAPEEELLPALALAAWGWRLLAWPPHPWLQRVSLMQGLPQALVLPLVPLVPLLPLLGLVLLPPPQCPLLRPWSPSLCWRM
jgi:hypothetical protein